MGMWKHDFEYVCPECGASVTREESTTKASSGRVGKCEACGWERDSKPTRTSNGIPLYYVTVR